MIPTNIRDLVNHINMDDKEAVEKFNDVYNGPYKRQLKLTSARDTNRKNYYFIVNIPSSTSNKRALSYDVIIEVSNPKNSPNNIFEKNVRFFSNSPSFSFFYAYVYNRHGLLIPWLKNKYSGTILQKRPTSRNPKEEVKLDQSLKTALLYIAEVYKFDDMGNSRKVNRIFRNTINKDVVYKGIPTALEKTEENKEVKQKEKRTEKRKQRVISTLKDPTSVFKPAPERRTTKKTRNYSTSNNKKRKPAVRKITSKKSTRR